MSVTAIVPVPECFVERRDAVFAPVAGSSSLARIVQTLAPVGEVVVCGAGPLVDEIRDVLLAHDLSGVRVVVADAPGLRAQCIAAGLQALTDVPQAHVLVHDIMWPLIDLAALGRVVDALRDGAVAALPTCPVTDSIKAVDNRGVITTTVDRAPLRTVQFPRGFTAGTLAQLVSGAGAEAFDEVDALLARGIPVTHVEGDNDTMSVQLPGDGAYLAAIIEGRRRHPGQ